LVIRVKCYVEFVRRRQKKKKERESGREMERERMLILPADIQKNGTLIVTRLLTESNEKVMLRVTSSKIA
jgi:hypothetical protein